MGLPVTRRFPSRPDLTQGDRMVVAAVLAEAARRGLMPDGTRQSALVGPQTDRELLDAVEELTGYHIPRVAVCTEHGHKSPAETFCDLYFERVSDVLWIGNRGGGKTTNSGFLHGAKNRWNPGYSSAISGAVALQGQRAYAEFRRFIRNVGGEVLDTLLSKTTWANGSLTEVLGGTVRALNGPHPVFAQMDEAELTTPEPFQEFLNMAQSTARYLRQQLLTTTRKRATGIVQNVVGECKQAERDGATPPWRIDIFCVFETMMQVPNCRTAPENADRDEAELCRCHRVRKGLYDDGTARTFDRECAGKAYRSDGFVTLEDVHRRFVQLSMSVWNAQQRCLTPDVEGLVHKWFNDRHRIPTWIPYAQFGPIYRGWDWGGQNPHAIVWVQKLAHDVGMAWLKVTDDQGREGWTFSPILSDDDDREIAYTLPTGSYVQFDEHHGDAGQLGEFSTLGLRAVLREVQWAMFGVPMEIAGDFCDPAGYIAKREVRKAVNQLIDQVGSGEYSAEVGGLLAEMGIPPEVLEGFEIVVPEFTSRPAPRVESIRKHIELGENDLIYVVTSMCPATEDEYDAYHWLAPKPGKNVPEDAAKEDDHAMDAKRYLIWNVEREGDKPPAEVPSADREAEQPLPPSMYRPPQTVTRDGSLPRPDEGHSTGPALDPGYSGEMRQMRSRSLPPRMR
jgi:hypothetical protein